MKPTSLGRFFASRRQNLSGTHRKRSFTRRNIEYCQLAAWQTRRQGIRRLLHQCQPTRLWPHWPLCAAEFSGLPKQTACIDWMQLSTTPSPSYDGYGFFWWLTDRGVFSAQGVFGQYILSDANRDLVVVLQRLARHGIQISRIGLCPLSALLPTMSFLGSSSIYPALRALRPFWQALPPRTGSIPRLDLSTAYRLQS